MPSSSSARAAAEWLPLTPIEAEVAEALALHFGPQRYASIPADLLVAFIRGNQDLIPRGGGVEAFLRGGAAAAASGAASDALSRRVHTTAILLEEALAWRDASYIDDGYVLRPPPGRAEFERLYQSGPIGLDAHGRPIILERLGPLAPAGRARASSSRSAAFDEEVCPTRCAANPHRPPPTPTHPNLPHTPTAPPLTPTLPPPLITPPLTPP